MRLVNEHDSNAAQSKARNLVINQLLSNGKNFSDNSEPVIGVESTD
jgi:hypothetical protein